IKANPELKQIFDKLIKTMKVNVLWNHIFVIGNNILILQGTTRSLFFNFDNKQVFTNIMELEMKEKNLIDITGNVIATNALNMVLYAFGKWGTIAGLKVEKDYAQLNFLFGGILKEIKVDPGYRNDYFRFYKSGIQITYEDVLQAAIEEGKKEKEPEEELDEEKLGLWHKVCWKAHSDTFYKEAMTYSERKNQRLGNNFYLVGYLCPNCGNKLHMIVYPVDKEFLIETNQGKVYLARAYTCNSCNSFYTPRPGKLLGEGDVYTLYFQEDRNAYEDYQELLGKTGEKTTNYKFNEFEVDRNRGKKELNSKTAEEACEELEDMSEEELLQLEEKLESGFYSGENLQNQLQQVKKQLEEPRDLKKIQEKKNTPIHKEELGFEKNRGKTVKNQEVRTGKDSTHTWKIGDTGTEKVMKENSLDRVNSQNVDGTEELCLEKKYDARMEVLPRMSVRQIKELKAQIQRENKLGESQKQEYLRSLDDSIYKMQEKEWTQKIQNSKNRGYAQTVRLIEEIENSDLPNEGKIHLLEPLGEIRREQAQKEAEELISNMPPVMDQDKYQIFREKLRGYKEADLAPYEEMLNQRRDLAQKQEIASLVKRTGKNDRNGLFRLIERLKGEEYQQENTAEVLPKLMKRIRALDELAIDQICPDVRTMTFEEGLAAYDKIAEGLFLPELKDNALEMLNKRLIKIKSDECDLLVRKIQTELSEKMQDSSGIYYYEARKEMIGEWNSPEADLIRSAKNIYASDCARYELPIIVCDSSRKGTGKEGFLLTPDHLFYNSVFSSECIPVTKIKSIVCSNGILNKGIYVNLINGEKVKLPNGITGSDRSDFVKAFGEFIHYLQEKPDSRKVSYLAKEEHEVKCCFRCGFTYEGGDICPKCGNKANR
ncbi:MAG: hypothetical protein RSD28_01620, partial [Lachnospiraceae bacterium]